MLAASLATHGPSGEYTVPVIARIHGTRKMLCIRIVSVSLTLGPRLDGARGIFARLSPSALDH